MKNCFGERGNLAAAKKAAAVLAKEGANFKNCPYHEEAKIITTRDGHILVTCIILHIFFVSGRINKHGCPKLSNGGCPFELNGKLISQ